MLGAIIQTLVAAFVIGVLARWAVPGPDPMPIWLTTFFGLVGAITGNVIAAAAFGREIDAGTAFAAWLLSIGAATLLVIGHRRFVQHRPIVGPDAHRPPKSTFGPGVRDGDDVTEQLRRLGQLREEGVISEEEFEQKKAELLARL
jgi:uncharacterized membrane protein YeaQ/YmgE (transglycosylase-associated protein family)